MLGYCLLCLNIKLKGDNAMQYRDIQKFARNERIKAGISQAELGVRADTCRTVVARFERMGGKLCAKRPYGISFMNIVRILDALGYELQIKKKDDAEKKEEG